MTKLQGISHRWPRPTLLAGLTLALVLGLLAPPRAALAHSADEYLQATYITVDPAQIEVDLNLTPGVLIAPEVLAELDSNGDEQISEAEGRAYAENVLRHVVLEVDGEPLTLTLSGIDMPPYLTLQAGYGTIRIATQTALAAGTAGTVGTVGTHQIAYVNNFAPAGATYQVNTFVAKDAAITLGTQNRDDIQQRLTVDYAIDGAAIALTENASLESQFEEAAGESAQGERLLAYLYEPVRSPWVLLLGLSLAGVLGGLHALTPGHGKTLVAAYLVGSRGTVGHAVTLGAIVTFTHTASVITIGLLALFASGYIVPDVLVPALTILSGLLVVGLGVHLIWQRWTAFRRSQPASHDHHHDHSHDHAHDHMHGRAHMHDHGDGHVHTHLPPAEGIRLSNLVALGVSGGLLPCPEALGIMVIAIGLNRILLGLGLIVSFSFGLAAVLIVIGVLLVRSRALVERVGGLGGRWSAALPLASAVIVTVLGIGITLGGLTTYLG